MEHKKQTGHICRWMAGGIMAAILIIGCTIMIGLSEWHDRKEIECRNTELHEWLKGLGERYESWLKEVKLGEVPADIASKLQNITRRSTLSQLPVQQLVKQSLDQITAITHYWQSRRKLYNLRLADLEGQDERATNAVKYQLLAFTSRPIYDSLTQGLYLPSTIYITNVVQFNKLPEPTEDYLFQKEKVLFWVKTADRKRRVTL